jgi:hydroxyquinol 1,2-dioxygenase
MHGSDADRLTDTVIKTFGGTPDPRLRELTTRLVHHLHAYVKDVKPTFDEWMQAIQFLTRVGQFCAGSRQEFILLSDVLGVSMLVDTVNHELPVGATESTVLGPVYVDNPPTMRLGADIADGLKGQPLYAEGIVRSASGVPLAGAQIDVWQADEEGLYDLQKPSFNVDHTELRARFFTDRDGRFHFRSIVPKFYSIPVDGPVGELVRATKRGVFRPAHLHFMISAPGFETLITHIFVKGDPHLHDDAVFAVKPSLVGDYIAKPAGVEAPDGRKMSEPWFLLKYDFGLKPAVAKAA